MVGLGEEIRRNREVNSSVHVKFFEDLCVVLAKHRRSRIDARATVSKSKSRKGDAETALDAVTRRMTVNHAAGFELRIGNRLTPRTDTRRRHVVGLQEDLPFSRPARPHDFAKHHRFARSASRSSFVFLIMSGRSSSVHNRRCWRKLLAPSITSPSLA